MAANNASGDVGGRGGHGLKNISRHLGGMIEQNAKKKFSARITDFL
jgi:hypothetical protein